MPLVGHAFVGVATAWSLPPKVKAQEADQEPGTWLSALVGLAYLPDIVGHGAALVGLGDWRVVSHSVVFAVVATAVLAPLLARGFEVSPGRAAAIVSGSVLGHDLLDFLPGSDHVLGWPLLDHRLGFRLTVIPENAIGEAVVFASAFLVFLTARIWFGKTTLFGGWRRGAWRGGAIAGLILVAAVVSHASKAMRDREVDAAEDLLRRHDYTEALARLDRLRFWPTVRGSSEVERLTARALIGIGDRAGAEERLLAAERREPGDYRTVVDLALFYASSNDSPTERRQKVAPYLTRLQHEFARRRGVGRALDQIAERLASSSTPAGQ